MTFEIEESNRQQANRDAGHRPLPAWYPDTYRSKSGTRFCVDHNTPTITCLATHRRIWEIEQASHWNDIDGHPVEDWRIEVANDETRLGYKQWAVNRESNQ